MLRERKLLLNNYLFILFRSPIMLGSNSELVYSVFFRFSLSIGNPRTALDIFAELATRVRAFFMIGFNSNGYGFSIAFS